MQQEVLDQVDREHIVEMACNLANIVSITGDEENVARYLGSEFEKLGMNVEYQYVEDGRPNVIGTLKGTGGGATLMFNAHMDHFDAPQETVVDEDRIYGRGLVNMKAAFPCYIEAVSALQKAGATLKRATGRSRALLLPSGGLACSDRFGGTHDLLHRVRCSTTGPRASAGT